MKKKDQTVEEMVMQAHYLDALEIESKAEKPLAEMERQDYIDTINDLKNTIISLRTSIDTLKTSMESMKESSAMNTKILLKAIEDLRRQLKDLQDQLAKVTEQRDELQARLNRELKNRYDKKSCSRKYGKGGRKNDGDRQQEQEEFVSKKEEEEKKKEGNTKDDTDGCNASSSDEANSNTNENTSGTTDVTYGIDQTKVKSEHLDEPRGERGKYNRMNSAKVVELKTSLEGAPQGMKFIGFKDVEEYDRISYVQCTVFKVAVFEDKYGKRHEYYRPAMEGDTRMPYVNTVLGTHCTPELLADEVIDNRMLFIPVYRGSIRNELDEFQVSKNTISNWLKKGARMLNPVLSLLKEGLLKTNSVLNIDETYSEVRIKLKGDGTKLGNYLKKYIWIIVNKVAGITYFFYDNEENDSRGTRPILQFLGGFRGAIQSDVYVVYKHLSDEDLNEHLMCWAYVHNKFKQCLDACKDKNAEWFLDKIAELYRIEKECIEANMTAAKIKDRRNQPDVGNILKALYKKGFELLNARRKHYSEMMRKALSYMVDNFDHLKKYRDDGRYFIDNLNAERGIRPFTVARKNSLFFSSEDGIEYALTYHTIIETCKNLGLNVKEYLVRAFLECMKSNPDYASINPCLLAAKAAQ